MPQLPVDCLNEIFEHLEKDKVTLHSCLLANRLWCMVSVRFLWKNVWNYSICDYRTLISCLPNESKEILNKNGIVISTPTSKPPLFNYAKFCKVLSISRVNYMIELLLKNQQQNLNNKYIVVQEIYKLFMNQIPSLKILDYCSSIKFISYPEANDCLKNLLELRCHSDELFCQLPKICHKIQSLDITFEMVVSDGLTDLISAQKNLKYLTMKQYHDCRNLADIVPSLTKLSNTLIKCELVLYNNYTLLSFIPKFTNLQVLELSILYNRNFEDFKQLQYAIFPQLQILKIKHTCPRYELLIKFLENNGKNLKEFYVGDNYNKQNGDNSLNLAIAKFCPNLRKLTGFKNSELESLKMIFNSCQYLECIKFWCGDGFLSEKEALEIFVKYLPKNVHELILWHLGNVQSELLPDELESFFVTWRNRRPQKSLSIIIITYGSNSLETNVENLKIIEKYSKLDVIRKFKVIKVIDFDEDY